MPNKANNTAAAKKVYKSYWDSYMKGDLTTFASTLDEDFEMIGTSESEDACAEKMGSFGSLAQSGSPRSVPPATSYKPRLSVRTGRNNQGVTIEIEDNGPGIPDEIKDKILQPFFTTKKGQGTGLGLSITHDIVKAQGGGLQIETDINKGTNFIIKLNA